MKRFITVKQLDGSEQHYTDADLPLIVGSGPDSHIKLSDADTSAAYIEDAQGHLFIQAGSQIRKPLVHNDHLLSESAWLKSKDQLSSESSVIHYELSGDRILFTVAELIQHSGNPSLSPPQEPPPALVWLPVSLEVELAKTDKTRSVLSLEQFGHLHP